MIPKKLIAAVIALAAVCTLPHPAQAQSSPPDERAAAREFAYAAYRLRVKIKAAAPAIRQVAEDLDTPACRTALGPDADADLDKLPRGAQIGIVATLVELELGASFAPVKDAYAQFITELDRVPTADPALIDGRNVWRTQVEFYEQLGPVPTDLCEQLRRWRLAGYPADAIPAAQPEAVHRALVAWVTHAVSSHEKPSEGRPEPRRAAKRMRQLGVSAAQAKRFTGETLLDGVDNGLITTEASP